MNPNQSLYTQPNYSQSSLNQNYLNQNFQTQNYQNYQNYQNQNQNLNQNQNYQNLNQNQNYQNPNYQNQMSNQTQSPQIYYNQGVNSNRHIEKQKIHNLLQEMINSRSDKKKGGSSNNNTKISNYHLFYSVDKDFRKDIFNMVKYHENNATPEQVNLDTIQFLVDKYPEQVESSFMKYNI